MARSTLHTPLLRLHKGTGQMYVNLAGRRQYLGKVGSPEVELRYNRMLAEWNHSGRQPFVSHDDLTVIELCARFLQHAKIYYDRSPKELHHLRVVLRMMKQTYGDIRARDFGPHAVKTIRPVLQEHIDAIRPHVSRQVWAIVELQLCTGVETLTEK